MKNLPEFNIKKTETEAGTKYEIPPEVAEHFVLRRVDRIIKRRLAEFGVAILAGMAVVWLVKEVFF